jgi:DNA-binding NtrC family response regulator
MPSYILIVDDDRPVRDAVAMALESEGYRVQTAEHGEAALTILAVAQPSLILLDLRMPTMDGWQVKALLEAQAPGVPVVVMSGVARMQALAERRTAAGYLQKPFGIDELLDLVRPLTGPPD